jgi:hypothetical protein
VIKHMQHHLSRTFDAPFRNIFFKLTETAQT